MTMVMERPVRTEAGTLSLYVARRREVARDIVAFELRAPDGGALPRFEAGAHLLVRTPSGVQRRYSLCNAPSERDRYVIAVKREAAGGGGSASMVDGLAEGDVLEVSPPENYFPLPARAASHLLVAGGIGITPVLAMAQHLKEAGAPFRLIYLTRDRESAAFLDMLEAELATHVTVHHDGGDPGRPFDLAALLSAVPEGGHLSCCGPRGLMAAVREASRHWPAGSVHFEDFGSAPALAAAGGERAFRVRLAHSGEVVEVPPGLSILEALRQQGRDLPCSCEVGTCGSCRTGLLSGVADHRDFVLDEDEAETAIMICVSRALSEELTLDA